MKILFICFSTLKFNVQTPWRKPLGGTESALCYLSTALAKLGHDVSLMRNTDDEIDRLTIDGVMHLKISENIVDPEPEVVIVASAPMAAPGIKKLLPRAKVIVWNHMRPDQPAMAQLFQPEFRAAIDEIVYVSGQQKKAFLDITNTVDGSVIENAISPCFENLFTGEEDILATKQCSGAYTSTPYRGLGVLAAIKELPIDIYSSMQVYQGDDTQYEKMYDALKANSCLSLHESAGQSYLAQALRGNAFLVYPSIFAECHSIAILEAMAAGLKVITTDLAHAQTRFVDSMPSKGATLEGYCALLRKNINFFRAHPEEFAVHMWKQVQYINSEFTWAKRAEQWALFLQNLIPATT